MRSSSGKAVFLWAAFAAASALMASCSTPDVRNEAVGQVNGEAIPARELREFLGYRGGAAPASDVPLEKKKEALDRLIAGRLLAQDARARGLDNTDEFRGAIRGNERDVRIVALFNRELAGIKVSDKEIAEEAKRLRDSDKNLSEKDAAARAGRAVFDRKARETEERLVEAARKAVPGNIDRGAVERIAKGEKVGDDVVLAAAGDDRITYGSVKGILAGAVAGQHGGQDLSRNPVAIGRVLEREVTGTALAAYAAKEGIAGSEWIRESRANLERTVLINLLAEKAVFGTIDVTDGEIESAYAEHAAMFLRDGKKIPLKQVREQIRTFIRNGKQRKAVDGYVEELRKKAKITVNESLFPRV